MTEAELIQEVRGRKPSLDKEKYTGYLNTVVSDHLAYAKTYTNNDFTVDGVEVIPGEVLSFVADACEYNLNPVGQESRRLGDVSYNYEPDYSPAMLRKLRPFKRVRF